MDDRQSNTGQTHVSGPALLLGPTRLLKNSEKNLMARLGMSTVPTYGRGGLLLVLLAELLLVFGAASRMVSLHTSGQLNRVTEVLDTFWELFYGNVETEIDAKVIKPLHMITATCGHMLLIPQLYILVVYAEEKVTIVLQLVLVLLVMVLTLITQTVHTIMGNTEIEELNCETKKSCFHILLAWMLLVNICIFLSIIIIRLIFSCRLKNWIIGIKIIGPIIDFSVSRRSRDFQSLVLIIILIVTVMSGMILNTDQLHSSKLDEINSKEVVVVTDLVSALVCLAGLLVLFIIYFYSHTCYSHTKVVSEHRLEQELTLLGERHKEVLMKNRKVSKNKYCPVTRTARPGNSGQML